MIMFRFAQCIVAFVLFAAIGSAASPVKLVEDYQVIQRDDWSKGSCQVVIPASMSSASSFDVVVMDETGKYAINQKGVAPVESTGEKGLVIENIPVGGPYNVLITAKGGPENKISFHNILVGDIW